MMIASKEDYWTSDALIVPGQNCFFSNFYVTYCPEDVEAPSTLIRIQTTVLDVVIDNPYISYIKMMDILDLL